jgi:hypothetical protein
METVGVVFMKEKVWAIASEVNETLGWRMKS